MIPLFKFRISGHSMKPAFKDGDIVLVSRLSYILRKPKTGDIVVLKRKNYIIKRIAKIKNNKFYIIGDNKKESTDSRSFGWIDRKEIIGKVIYSLSS